MSSRSRPRRGGGISLIGAIALMAVSGASGASLACATPASRCAVSPAPAAEPRPLLWRVERPGGAVVWLYGTLHDAGRADVAPAAWASLEASPAFVSELGDDEPEPRKLAALARLPWGQVLDRQLPEDDWWELVNAMLGVMSEDELRHARPWYAVVRLNGHMAQSPRPSMDAALVEHARARGLPVARLESWEDQLVALDATVTPADLSRAIHGRRAVACEVERLRAAYRAGDLPVLSRALVGPDTARLLGERNQRWLPALERYLAGSGAFVAVGLGHLLGDAGLPAMLERAGYRVAFTER